MSIPGVFKAQSADIEHALYEAERLSRVVASEKNPRWLSRLLLLKFAYLARACELACVPLYLYPVETAQGVEMAWYTYRPVADIDSGRSFHSPVMVGYESSMTEDQARSRAIGY